MVNREVSLGICGVVVGILIGAGSVLYVQDVSLSASSSENYSLRPGIYDVHPVDRRNSRAAESSQVPVNTPLTTIKRDTGDGLDQPPVGKVNNNCDTLRPGSTRYTKCIGSQNEGERWDNR